MTPAELTPAEKAYYARHLSMRQFGVQGQLALRRSSALVVGAGGLGSAIIQYLAAAGVGRLGILDNDTVDISNLHRQVQFTIDDVGQPKALAAQRRSQRQNPHIEVIAHTCRLEAVNARSMVALYDVVVDGSDNFTTKFLLNDACYFEGKPLVFGAVFQFEGQVSVFNADCGGTRGPNYRDLVPTLPPPELSPNCTEAGVLGVVPGLVGCLQAGEVVKLLTGVGSPLSGRLLTIDVLGGESRTLSIRKSPANPLSGTSPSIHHVRAEPQAGPSCNADIETVGLQELLALIAGNQALLLDVRESHERALCSLGGLHVPLDDLASFRIDATKGQNNIVVYCESGLRSVRAARQLGERLEARVLSLRGGLRSLREAGHDLDVIRAKLSA